MSGSPEGSTGRGGLIINTSWGLRFVAAQAAIGMVPAGPVVSVPGLMEPALGIALAEDRVVTVFAVGPALQQPMIVCEVQAGAVALAGAVVLACSAFEALPGSNGVKWQGQPVEPLDVEAIAALAEAAAWHGRHEEVVRS